MGVRIAFGVFAFLFAILPIILGALDTVRLQCDRRSGEVICEYSQHLFGVQRVALTIEHVQGAKLGVAVSRKGNGRTYRPELLTAKGETPLFTGYTYNEALHRALVDSVNDYIASSAPTLQLEQPGWGRLFAACMALGWVVIVLFLWRMGVVS